MLQIRKAADRGHADHGWLKTAHTFSFADYHDTKFMGFRVLRVINDDHVAGGGGFPTHPHRDMEIITYVIRGALEHRDTLGTHSVIRPGEVQYMNAGRGVRHSEFNASANEEVHLLQIWILPAAADTDPDYGQKSFTDSLAQNSFVLTASPRGQDGAIKIQQDVDLYAAKWPAGRIETFKFRSEKRFGWLQLVDGELSVSGQNLGPGDGLAIAGEGQIRLESAGPVEFLLFDLP